MQSGSACARMLGVAMWVAAAWGCASGGSTWAAQPRPASSLYPEIPMATAVAPAGGAAPDFSRAPRSGPIAQTTPNAWPTRLAAAQAPLASEPSPPLPVEDPAELEPPKRRVTASRSLDDATSDPPAAPAAAEQDSPGQDSDGLRPLGPDSARLFTFGPSGVSSPYQASEKPNPAFDPRFPGDPGPLDDNTSITRGIHDFFSGRTFPTEGFPAYTISATALILHRSDAKSVPLVSGAGGTLLGAGGLNPGFAVGPRFDLTMHFASGYNFGFVFYGLEGWHAQQQLSSGPGGLQVPAFGGDRFSHINAAYNSRLFNEEINSSHSLWGPVNILSGFRALELNENLNIAGSGLTTNGSGNIKTRNWLLGLQLGLESLLVERGPISLTAYTKGGIFINPARVTTNQTGDVTLPSGSNNGAHEAFVGDVGLNLNYRIRGDWTATIGYQALWIDRVALAPNQLATLPKVNFSGDVFLSGLQLGLVKPF